MNAPPDLLRSGMAHPNMLNIPPHFLQQQQHGQPPQGQPAQVGLLSNGPNPNSSMALLGNNQSSNPNANPSSSLQLQQSNNHIRQQMLMHQGQNPNLARPPVPHVNGIGGHNQLQNLNFPNNMMGPQQQQQVRRVLSQQSQLNQNGSPIVGLPQGMTSLGGMSMAPGQNMHLRQALHPLNNIRLQSQQPQHSISGHMSPDMPMSMNRPPHLPVNNALPPHANRTPSAQPQLIPNLPPQNSLTQSHPPGMQNPMHQNPFQSPMTLSHQHQQQQLGSSPHAGSHSQTHTPANLGPNMAQTNIPPSQPPVNRSQMTPENNTMFMNFSNPPMQHNVPQVPRLPPNNAQFPFGHGPSPSPMPQNEMSQNMAGGQLNATGMNSRANLMTPAQVLNHMGQGDGHMNTSFEMAQSQQNGPARPPSQHASHVPFPPQQQALPHHQSPRSSEHMIPHPGQVQRPQSQQGQQRQSPQQPGQRTPRVSQPSLPGMAPPRMPMQGPNPAGPSQQQQQQQQQSQPQPQAPPVHPSQQPPRQVPGSAPGAPPANGPAPTPQQPTEGQPMSQASALGSLQHHYRSIPPTLNFSVGMGQATLRILQLSGVLQDPDGKNGIHKKQLQYWDNIVKEYFAPKATMKFTLWKDNQRQEAKPFEIGTPILPRFFLVTTQSGVKSMSICLDGAREKPITHGQAVVECAHAVWTFKYTNGYTVMLNGPLTAYFTTVPAPPAPNQAPPVNAGWQLKIDSLSFDATSHDKMINVDAIGASVVDGSPAQSSLGGMGGLQSGPRREDDDRKFEEPRTILPKASLPGEPINAFGIPQATMRCLELAESVSQMGDLIQFSTERRLGPRDALAQYANQLRSRDMGGSTRPNQQGPSGTGIGGSSSIFDGVNGMGSAAYSSTSNPPSISTQTPTPSTPQNPPMLPDGSGKQGKAPAPSSSQASSSTPSASASTPAAAATPGASTTPSMANATLKRKSTQRTEDGSPVVANSEPPPAKRQSRKRGRTQGG